MNEEKVGERVAKRVRHTPRGIIHAIAQCHDCDWTDDDYLVARKRAWKHARERRHVVGIEEAFVTKLVPEEREAVVGAEDR